MDTVLGYILFAVVVLVGIYKTITGESQAAGTAVQDPEASGSGSPGTPPPQVERWKIYAQNYSKRLGVPWRVVMAVIWQESGGDPNARGSAGEIGLMQVKPDAAEDAGVFTEVDPTGWRRDPEKNIEVGTAYLSVNLMRGRAAGDMFTALRMYNQGPTGYLDNPVKSKIYANEVLAKAERLGYNV